MRKDCGKSNGIDASDLAGINGTLDQQRLRFITMEARLRKKGDLFSQVLDGGIAASNVKQLKKMIEGRKSCYTGHWRAALRHNGLQYMDDSNANQQEYKHGSRGDSEEDQVKINWYRRRCFQEQFDVRSHFVILMF